MPRIRIGSALLDLRATSLTLAPTCAGDGRHYQLAHKRNHIIQHRTFPHRPKPHRYENLPTFRAVDIDNWRARVESELFVEWATRTSRIDDAASGWTVFVPKQRVLDEIVGLISNIEHRESRLLDVLESIVAIGRDSTMFERVPLRQLARSWFAVLGADGVLRRFHLAAANGNDATPGEFFLVSHMPDGLLWDQPGLYASPVRVMTSERTRDIAIKPLGDRFWKTLHSVSNLFGANPAWIERLRSGPALERPTIVDVAYARSASVTTLALAASCARPASVILKICRDDAREEGDDDWSVQHGGALKRSPCLRGPDGGPRRPAGRVPVVTVAAA